MDLLFNGMFRITDVTATTFSYLRAGASDIAATDVNGPGYATPSGKLNNGIARLNADGTVDAAADFGAGFDAAVETIGVDGGNRVSVGGRFTGYDGMTGLGLDYFVRLESSAGVLDESHNQTTGANDTIEAVSLDASGKVIVGGHFTAINGASRNRIARLDESGATEPAFNVGTGANSVVRAIAVDRNTDPFVRATWARSSLAASLPA